jgi:hypothetical protein
MLKHKLWDAMAIVHMPCLLFYLNEIILRLILAARACRLWVADYTLIG